MNTYFPYHVHTELSLLDSCTNYKLYVDKCKEYNIPVIAFSEHGVMYNWQDKRAYCKKNNIKYVHACEVYLTEQLEPKVRDNYHTVLIAANLEGFYELNELLSKASDEQHKYYDPRITFDEFLNTSQNILSTSACLASPLNKLSEDNPYYEKLLNKYDFLEIQLHNYEPQKIFNKKLYDLALKHNKPLIVGTDTHSVNKYKAECRSILKTAKKIIYSDEDAFDLTFKSYDELIDLAKAQNSLDMAVYYEALENTNKLNSMIEEYDINTEFKYPDLYSNEEKTFRQTVIQGYNNKIKNGIIEDNEIYKQRLNEEFKVFKKLKMFSFMLFMSELTTWCHENDIPTGFCRGSVGGSLVAYILDIIDLDPVKWNTIFSRFANEDRVSLGDIDVDFSPKDREKVYEYIIKRFGHNKTSYILTTNTISDKGTIDEIGRALSYKWSKENEVAIKNGDIKESNNPYSLSKIAGIKKEFEEDPEKTKEKYKDIFYYFDGLKNTVISQGVHPAGIVASPITLSNNICLFYYDGKWVSQINMDELHDLNYVKYDILGLKNVGVIKDTYKYINSHYLLSHEINWEDQAVWENIITSPVGIFQFEGDYAFDLLQRYSPCKINDLSLVNASLRPSGDSYRNDLIAHKFHTNPSNEIDDLLKDNSGFLVFQEDTLKFLMNICGFSGSHADNVRRAIGQKKEEVLKEELPKILDGYCNYANKPREIAEEEAKEFIQIISDSSSYQFGYNHSTGYSMIGYVCGYLRYYYPLEFITAYLNNAQNEADIVAGTNLAKDKNIPINHIKFRYSKGEYTCDKETNSIYKGIGSIKYLNTQVGDDLYKLYKNTYDTFTDLLIDLVENITIDSKQTKILISLNFFEEFGNNKKLLSIYELFQKRYKKTHKDKTKVERIKEIKAYELEAENKKLTVKEQIESEYTYLGYAISKYPQYKNKAIIISVDTKYTPKVTLYKIDEGLEVMYKVYKKNFNKNPLAEYDIIEIGMLGLKNKKRMVDGQWTELDEKETIMEGYKKLNQSS